MSGEQLSRGAKRQAAIAKAYSEVFAKGAGEFVLHDILKEAGLLSVAHVAGDSHSTAWNDGRKSLALTIIERLRWTEGHIVKLAQLTATQELQEEIF